jgi:hypothetical protein
MPSLATTHCAFSRHHHRGAPFLAPLCARSGGNAANGETGRVQFRAVPIRYGKLGRTAMRLYTSVLRTDKLQCRVALTVQREAHTQPMEVEMTRSNTTVIRKTISIVPAKMRKPFQFRNYYRCPNDGTKWHDEWDHRCNDRCPTCDSEIEPYFSEDVVRC